MSDTKEEVCDQAGCARRAALTIRKETPEEAMFERFCKRHFSVALELVRALWKIKYTAPGTLPCCSTGCSHKAVISLRILTDQGPEFMCFCTAHLSIAFEAMATLHEAA